MIGIELERRIQEITKNG